MAGSLWVCGRRERWGDSAANQPGEGDPDITSYQRVCRVYVRRLGRLAAASRRQGVDLDDAGLRALGQTDRPADCWKLRTAGAMADRGVLIIRAARNFYGSPRCGWRQAGRGQRKG